KCLRTQACQDSPYKTRTLFLGRLHRSDPKTSHLDGLNLSRAWCWRLLEPALPEPLRPLAVRAWSDHIEASLPYAVAGDYVSTHWLASFALLAMAEPVGG
ncbi:DUF2891 family protein, partial [Cupriavidus sp. amp6]|uniref:DUF2891 family protein n=1 Tax=Cupriavidus sp. amp6 TaxID=388051 RepID=UPI0012EB858D